MKPAKIIECIPNFSEGRDPEIIKAIAAAASAVSGVRLLDYSWDRDHHRSVITFLGEPEYVYEAALAAGSKALELIDLSCHDGVHPRIGALDVVPFVPLEGAKMSDAVACAHRFGRAFAAEHGVPVFFYGEAAKNEASRELPKIRRGGLPGLIKRMAAGTYKPDEGPDVCPDRSGAVAVGARMPLIAYNINLDSSDVGLAKRIAGVIRESNGGLPSVRAIGVLLKSRNLAQVSMNLTNFHVTSMREVFDSVRKEADLAGVSIRESELIGLAPRAALDEETAAYIRLIGFSAQRIIETHLPLN
ncbi:MAG: glutamate formimidoyltransferase [Syntrophales bacterium]